MLVLDLDEIEGRLEGDAVFLRADVRALLVEVRRLREAGERVRTVNLKADVEVFRRQRDALEIKVNDLEVKLACWREQARVEALS